MACSHNESLSKGANDLQQVQLSYATYALEFWLSQVSQVGLQLADQVGFPPPRFGVRFGVAGNPLGGAGRSLSMSKVFSSAWHLAGTIMNHLY